MSPCGSGWLVHCLFRGRSCLIRLLATLRGASDQKVAQQYKPCNTKVCNKGFSRDIQHMVVGLEARPSSALAAGRLPRGPSFTIRLHADPACRRRQDAGRRALARPGAVRHAVDIVPRRGGRPCARPRQLRPGDPGHRLARAERPGRAAAPARAQVHDAGADAHRVRRPGKTACAGSTWAPTTTWPSRSTCPSSKRACARCCAAAANSTPYLQHGLLRLDTVGRRVFYDKRPLDLSPRELAVLELLLMRAGRVVSKEQMVNHLYGWGDEVGDNAIEVNVYRLRKKLEPLGCEIRTVRGMGYLMDSGRCARLSRGCSASCWPGCSVRCSRCWCWTRPPPIGTRCVSPTSPTTARCTRSAREIVLHVKLEGAGPRLEISRPPPSNPAAGPGRPARLPRRRRRAAPHLGGDAQLPRPPRRPPTTASRASTAMRCTASRCG